MIYDCYTIYSSTHVYILYQLSLPHRFASLYIQAIPIQFFGLFNIQSCFLHDIKAQFLNHPYHFSPPFFQCSSNTASFRFLSSKCPFELVKPLIKRSKVDLSTPFKSIQLEPSHTLKCCLKILPILPCTPCATKHLHAQSHTFSFHLACHRFPIRCQHNKVQCQPQSYVTYWEFCPKFQLIG